MTEAAPDLYRIGVVGPADTGKSLLLSGFQKAVTVECPVCSTHQTTTSADRTFPSAHQQRDSSVMDDSLHDINQRPADVFSVVVKGKGPLGIKIAAHKKYMGFVCVKAFVRESSSGSALELERSGKVCPGDLLVAVNRQNLLNMPPQDITTILRNDSEMRVLTFLRTAVGPASEYSSLDVSTSSALGTADISVDVEEACQCSTWRTYVTIDGRARCLEIVELPGQDTSLSLLRSHVSGFDGMLFVYSLETTPSLLLLEKRYARALPGMLAAKLNVKGIEEYPLTVAGTIRGGGGGGEGTPVAANASMMADLIRRRLNQRQLLLAEGNAFAEVWGAAPVIQVDLLRDNMQNSDSDGAIPPHLIDIFENLIRRVDARDEPSCFIDDDTTCTSVLGFSCYLPMCFGDTADINPAVDVSVAGKMDTSDPLPVSNHTGDSDKTVKKRAKLRKTTRKLRPYVGFEQSSCSPQTVATRTFSSSVHPSEDFPFGAMSTKLLKYIVSSCE